MNLIPWRKSDRSELQPLSTLERETESFFGDFFSDSWLRGFFRSEGASGFTPAVDLRETDDKVLVEAELPGVDPKDVQVHVEGNLLRIRGERKQEKEEKTKGYYRVERSFGQFERVLNLPEGVDPEKVEAGFKNGLLTIELEKVPIAKPRSIEVKVRS